MIPEIRQMTAADKPAIMQILHSTPEFKPAEVQVAEELIDIFLNSGTSSGYYILIVKANAAIAGYVCYGPTPLTEGTWDIYWIAVARNVQGKGIGSVLMASAEDEIQKTKGRLIVIETSSLPSYDKTRKFYLARGYQFACQIADYYEPGDDQVLYTKRL